MYRRIVLFISMALYGCVIHVMQNESHAERQIQRQNSMAMISEKGSSSDSSRSETPSNQSISIDDKKVLQTFRRLESHVSFLGLMSPDTRQEEQKNLTEKFESFKLEHGQILSRCNSLESSEKKKFSKENSNRYCLVNSGMQKQDSCRGLLVHKDSDMSCLDRTLSEIELPKLQPSASYKRHALIVKKFERQRELAIRVMISNGMLQAENKNK